MFRGVEGTISPTKTKQDNITLYILNDNKSFVGGRQ